MKHVLLFLLLISPAAAQDPPPPTPPPVAQAALVAPGASGTGKRDDPYLFTTATKCVLRLTGSATDAVWDQSDAPADFEVLGQVGVFSLAEPGLYVVYVRGDTWHVKSWFQIQSSQDPPPRDTLARRVKGALAGPDAKVDAARFGAVCGELAKALDAGGIQQLAGMESSLKAGLDAVGWKSGKYPALSTLAGELFGAGVPDRPLDADTRTQFARQLRVIATACEEVAR